MASIYQNVVDLRANVSELIDSIEACLTEVTPLLIKSKNEGGSLSESIEKMIKEMEDSKELLRVLSDLFDSIKAEINLASSVEVPAGSGGSNEASLTIVSEPRNFVEAYERKITDFMKSKKEGGSSNEGIEIPKKYLEDVNRKLNELTMTDSLTDDDSKKEKVEDEKIKDVLKSVSSQFEKARGDIDLALEVGSASGGKVKEESSNEEI